VRACVDACVCTWGMWGEGLSLYWVCVLAAVSPYGVCMRACKLVCVCLCACVSVPTVLYHRTLRCPHTERQLALTTCALQTCARHLDIIYTLWCSHTHCDGHIHIVNTLVTYTWCMALQRYARHFDITYTLCCSPLSYVHWSHTHSLHKGHIHGGHIQTGHIHLGHIHIVSLSNWQHTLCPHAYCSVSLYKHAHITYTRLTVLFQDTVFINICITL